MSDFQIGDIVELNTGGQKMTVHHITDAGEICCWWFHNFELEKDLFDARCLVVVK